MRYLLVSIRDRAVGAFGPIQNVRAEGEAIRGFIDAINNPESRTLHNHPDDHDLYLVGYFDDQLGTIERLDTAQQLADGKTIAAQQRAEWEATRTTG